MHTLEGVWLKTIRAKEHLDILDNEIQMFWNCKPLEYIPEDDHKRTEKSFRIEVSKEPPLVWSVIVGDFAYNLRSALDHLVWQLALLNTNNPNQRTEFPIFKTPQQFEKLVGKKNNKISDIPADRNIISDIRTLTDSKRILGGNQVGCWCIPISRVHICRILVDINRIANSSLSV